MKLVRLFALCVASALACDNPVEPPLRSYQLTEVNGVRLPYRSQGIDGGSDLLSGRLYVNSTDRALRIDSYRDWSAMTPGPLDRTERLQGQYRIANDSITFTYGLGCGNGCTVDQVGFFSDTLITLRFADPQVIQTVYTYRRSNGMPPIF